MAERGRRGRDAPPRAEELIGTVRAFAGRRVAVLADLVVDAFIYGDIERISREAPVPILNEQRVVRTPGGGGNAIANLRALGARPLPVGVVGRDDAGDFLVETLRAEGLAVGGILRLADRPTPTKSRVLAGGIHTRRQQIVRIDRGVRRGLALPPAVAARLDRALERSLDRSEGLLVADYGYESATPRRVAPHVKTLRHRGGVIAVDSRERIERYRGVTACTPNLEELGQAAGTDELRSERAISRAAAGLRTTMRAGAVLVTRGAEGMSLFAGSAPFHVPAWGAGDVADVTGAGDTVVATFTLALVAGATLPVATRLANYAAGIVVQKAGTATLGPDELIEAVQEDLG